MTSEPLEPNPRLSRNPVRERRSCLLWQQSEGTLLRTHSLAVRAGYTRLFADRRYGQSPRNCSCYMLALLVDHGSVTGIIRRRSSRAVLMSITFNVDNQDKQQGSWISWLALSLSSSESS